MYKVKSKIYQQIANMLLEHIGTKEFFTGHIVHYDGEVECRLTCTLIIQHAARDRRTVENITPIWWSLTTTVGQDELFNDFSFNELKEHIFNQ